MKPAPGRRSRRSAASVSGPDSGLSGRRESAGLFRGLARIVRIHNLGFPTVLWRGVLGGGLNMDQRIYSTGGLGEKTGAQAVAPEAALSPQDVDVRLPVYRVSAGYRVFQRAADLAIAGALLALLLIPCLLLAVAIVVESPGPVLFRQRRVGRRGRSFWFYKFRSMVADAEGQRKALLRLNEATGPIFKIRKDPRITRVGRFIRKYSIDEIPQLINVLKGDMSMVGPRPAIPSEVQQYSSRQKARLEAVPGLTGLWQISGRSDLSFEKSVELDLDYIAHQSCWLYLKILVLTVPAVIMARGAY